MGNGIRAVVITVSDRCAAGEREDVSGARAAALLAEAGYDVEPVRVVPDGADAVETALRDAVDGGARLVLTSGGTGISPRDRTPEGTVRVLEVELPGIAEELRRRDAAVVPTAILSRGVAGTLGGAFVVNAPGSPGGAASAVAVLLPLVPHILDQLDGGDHG
ncbi:MogA/MoaB family molybdenum cofactor biosynthesis protein [Occultella glacieicola]|uniref:MogA/MoaB family molybdenum cofactor biosynthesis protein n=1 Tax=Occultella glacieicola TaxID=2518684 RepID=A0ABY2E4Z2_9MICO|nr:MogA/MoaB family molybdenum cofactor biosynthesis protein [Occultella glacieicola]TDE94189.1 MogA/MoaB family molybdenum cofactor biosynthesis protein [Occultella glacieicola]